MSLRENKYSDIKSQKYSLVPIFEVLPRSNNSRNVLSRRLNKNTKVYDKFIGYTLSDKGSNIKYNSLYITITTQINRECLEVYAYIVSDLHKDIIWPDINYFPYN